MRQPSPSRRTDVAGVNRTYLSKLEKGASYPGLEIIAKLATVADPASTRAWLGRIIMVARSGFSIGEGRWLSDRYRYWLDTPAGPIAPPFP
jgi:transcriptional regulator with XRE-family HTH domain